MNIKNCDRSYDEISKMKKTSYIKPKKPNIFFRTLLKVASLPSIISTGFKCEKIGMDKLGRRQPCLILMNHSSFIDLEIASSVLYPRPFNIVATLDAFIGKRWLMRELGCIATRKFVLDLSLVRDINNCIKKQKTSVLMYPEAGYSFDGTATTLPDSLGGLVKMLGVPLVVIETFGAYHRQPLYNDLRKRKIKVSAQMRYVLSPEQISEMSAEEIFEVIKQEFSFDNYRRQQECGIVVDEPLRAQGLERILYKCPSCMTEGKMLGEGVYVRCCACNKKWELTEKGFLRADSGNTEFDHIPDWYRWEREQVREELGRGEYGFEVPVDIYMIVNTKGVYRAGQGTLTHSPEGLHLVGCDGKIDYMQKSISLYSLNSDFYWYKLGDVIGFGNKDALYYCRPLENPYVVAKARLATEEIYKTLKSSKG